MIVSIALDQNHSSFTNLDTISGKVHLRVNSNSNVNSIVVKLEGESRTRLLAPVHPDSSQRPRPVLEVHKILYQVVQVFPPQQMREGTNEQKSYTLNTGTYEYPFSFRIPFNNACTSINSFASNINVGGLGLEFAKNPTRHVKQTLPPTLSGFPGEAEIRYYVKCTVNRTSFFKENPRAFANFKFLPIEPPRPAQSDGESYARRQHQFNPKVLAPPRKKSIFGIGGDPKLSEDDGPKTPPRFSVDARLPNPPILTCNDTLPLRIIIKQLSDRTEPLFLQMLQIELIGYTEVRAHDITRTESNSWVIVSFSNMSIPIGTPADVVGAENLVNKEYWENRPLPNSVAPSFVGCNLSRRYELEVRVGLGYGNSKAGLDQMTILPLRLLVKVYSGIAPPIELLDAMSRKPTSKLSIRPERPQLDIPSPGAVGPGGSSLGVPQTPIGPPSPSYQQHAPQQGFAQSQSAPAYEDAPPSYEDAIAVDMPPINGPRRDYVPPPTPPGAPRFSGDDKR